MSGPWRATVNGLPVERGDVPVEERLLDTLRWRLGLKGTKEGCRSGDCGACTVLVDDRSSLSCLTLTHEVDGSRILTIEGAPTDPVVQKVQGAFRDATAVQCGYCTPGFILALASLLKERRGDGSASELLSDLQGNLCRCTGYSAIVRAVESLAKEPR